MQRTLSLVSLQGEPDRVKATRSLSDAEKANAKADVTAVYGDGVSRVELHITDWDEAAAVPAEITITG